jgi:hypothetical protein
MKAVSFLIAAVAAVTIAGSANAFDQAAAQQACGNDVFAMCQQDIPDQGRITACLRKNYSHVSGSCRAFMAASAKEMQRGKQRETTASAVHDEVSPRRR